MEVETEFRKIKQIVDEIMTDDERAKNDDKWLIYKVVSKFTKIYIPFEDFDKFPAFETITRVRREIQNNENTL